jgi:perosamine synthetase
MKTIPVYEPILNQGNEKKYLKQCIDSGWVSSDGYFVRKFEEEFAKWSGNKYAVAVCNGTAALETAIWASGIDEDISIPTGTIISCAIAAIRNKLRIKLYEGHHLANNIMRCHLFGQWQEATGFNVIDDCSQYWKPFKVQGAACYSLYANKLISSGEGGIIVTNEEGIYKEAISYRNLCHSEERFVHNELGYNFRMSNLQGAVALAQLEQIDKFIAIKQKNRDLYLKYLPNNIQQSFNVEVPWMYLIKTKIPAKEMVDKLKERFIDCRRFFCPLHMQPCLVAETNQSFPYAEDMWKYAFYLPSGLTLTEKEVRYVCKSLELMLNSMI